MTACAQSAVWRSSPRRPVLEKPPWPALGFIQHRHSDLAAAWLSLDEQDNDPAQFWAYVVGAFQTIDPHVGEDAQTLLAAGQLTHTELVLTTLLNDLAQIPFPILLALDDFHLIDQDAILRSVAYLLDRLPPNVHVLILTRADPHLPLARYRSRGQLVEVRLSELRFSLDETSLFLNTTMQLNLARAPIKTLHTKTEGWIAGLQMAALTLRDAALNQEAGQNQVADFVASFSGSNRFILDYLIEEVLRGQPKPVQEFLLKTSILERLCAGLCDEVIHDPTQAELPSAQSTLEYLERANLFLVALDPGRCWFRYHPLFADLLKKRLHQAGPASERELHARASQWYAENHLPHQAVEHAFLARDPVRDSCWRCMVRPCSNMANTRGCSTGSRSSPLSNSRHTGTFTSIKPRCMPRLGS